MKICLYAIAKNEIKEVDAWYESMKEADEIIVLDKGKIVERGTHQELMDSRGWYYEQYKIQEMGGTDNE